MSIGTEQLPATGTTDNLAVDNRAVIIFICPNRKCNNYYGSTRMPDLSQEKVWGASHSKDAGKVKHMRSRCPDCGADREKKTAVVL